MPLQEQSDVPFKVKDHTAQNGEVPNLKVAPLWFKSSQFDLEWGILNLPTLERKTFELVNENHHKILL